VLDSLTRLVDKNLVEYDDTTGRYRMLETIRQYGLERLDQAGQTEQTRRRHAEHWAARALLIGPWGRFDPAAVREALTDIMTMLDWAMIHDPDLADRLLASIAIQVFGLRWPAAHRACDWVLTDRSRSLHWPGALGAVSVSAMLLGRTDVFTLTDEAVRLAEEAHDTSAVHHLRMGSAYACVFAGDLSPARALVIDATAAGDDFPAFGTATMIIPCLGALGQLDELNALCRLGAQLAG
jgi:hypothetical protein